MPHRLPSLKALRAFEAAGRLTSFSKAADELFVTHAAVSRHIRDLEEWFGTKLFVRTGRGVELTELGAGYLRDVSAAFDRLARGTQKVIEELGGARLSVSVEEAFASRWLVPVLGHFTANHADIELSLDPNDDLIDFRSGNFDLGIRYGGGKPDWPDVDVELLCDVLIFPVCSPNLANLEQLQTPADITQFPLLHEDSKQWWQAWLDAEGVGEGATTRGPMFQGHLALEAAEADQGFALGDQILTSEALKEGWLVKPLEGAEQHGAYYIVSPKGRSDGEPAQAFRAWLHAEVGETDRWFRANQVS